MRYLFSIIIPVFNSEKYLNESINSVLRQKSKNTEIILINDCSTDRTRKICNFYKAKYSFIKVLHHKKNYGVGNSRNAGIGISKGKYLFLLPGSPSACKDAWDQIIRHQLDSSFKPCNLVEILPKIK